MIDGAALSPLWGVPFAGLLLSIALMPLVLPSFWHHHYGKVALAWSLAFLLPFGATYGAALAGEQLVHAALAEYVPFIILLTALFTVAGGIHIRGNLHGAPGLNVAILAIGAVLASFMGTTGASMLLIRPLIRANDNRVHKAHVVVFFNTAGGDPAALMTTFATTLAAISAGAVFMGANTYIGNAPNLMVKAIAESRGVKMPSFFGYMAWSGAILVPLFVVATFIFFR